MPKIEYSTIATIEDTQLAFHEEFVRILERNTFIGKNMHGKDNLASNDDGLKR